MYSAVENGLHNMFVKYLTDLNQNRQGCVWPIMNQDLIAVPLVKRILMGVKIWACSKFPKNGGVNGTKFRLFPVM